ncbi:hypothetical protein ASPVEDRAFT_81822 [Aspergillus versicolor CBS 583.65]|uniref:DUF7730 domain-containing protein n=1 Tax=Aspergillus versicolor CBS 583.65 TaxID=1036611 RepID=A0A1L9PFM6_ASPVE|nr:uncharacterized protein ASPVEDRAFT_81822 [Aspergillus versicolor CBS 583.65]OJJ00246.1 hypothetical protein ASPVEDRAFT_81822 [Aspergillus versicolor CBS 583.65]
MTSSVNRKRTGPPVSLDTDDDMSTETRESKRGRYDTSNSLEAGSPQNPAQNSLFLNLPLELRLQIYDLLLVSRITDGKAPFESMAKDYQRPVLLTSSFAWIWDHSIFPAILQSCQKIYNEALPVLYGNNIFEFDDSAYIHQISRLKVNLLRHLIIDLSVFSEATSWVSLLDVLIEEAKDLRNLKVIFDAHYYDSFLLDPQAHGLGADVPFVRTLTRVKQLGKLETLIIAGFYAKHWPAYLRQEMRNDIKIVFEAGVLNARAFSDENTRSQIHNFQVALLKNYQEGTERLMP